jgi:hypothetical protein
MKKALLAAVTALAFTPCAFADRDNDNKFRLKLTGFQETPLTLSSPASGEFEARIVDHDTQIDWELSYRGFPTNVLQAHIHFGARAITGGISIFLCTNLGNGPAGTQPCPQMGTISGTSGRPMSSGRPARASRPASWPRSSPRSARALRM